MYIIIFVNINISSVLELSYFAKLIKNIQRLYILMTIEVKLLANNFFLVFSFLKIKKNNN